MSKELKVDCPRCGGFGFDDFDEAGKPYVCYFCGASGLVLASVAAEEARACAWAFYVRAEKAVKDRVAAGVPYGWSWYYDGESGEIVMRPPRGERPAAPARIEAADLEDIPF